VLKVIEFRELKVEESYSIKELVNELMYYQKTLASINKELFDSMNYETRMVPSIKSSRDNFIMAVYDDSEPVAYVYSNVSFKNVYNNDFATFFDMDSVKGAYVGCLSQFYIKEKYRNLGIGRKLFDLSDEWMNSFDDIEDIFIFVSDGNNLALEFYKKRGYIISHEILNGFITILRKKKS
jgi:ribosomal protein S18 acetylase RimI-like enzyme